VTFKCWDCHREFDTPSFSEGPKVENKETGKVERFTEACSMCPHCLSTNIKPLKRRRTGATSRYLRRRGRTKT